MYQRLLGLNFHIEAFVKNPGLKTTEAMYGILV